jgi:hypothetical protein
LSTAACFIFRALHAKRRWLCVEHFASNASYRIHSSLSSAFALVIRFDQSLWNSLMVANPENFYVTFRLRPHYFQGHALYIRLQFSPSGYQRHLCLCHTHQPTTIHKVGAYVRFTAIF